MTDAWTISVTNERSVWTFIRSTRRASLSGLGMRVARQAILSTHASVTFALATATPSRRTRLRRDEAARAALDRFDRDIERIVQTRGRRKSISNRRTTKAAPEVLLERGQRKSKRREPSVRARSMNLR
jgi:hypothetical protein